MALGITFFLIFAMAVAAIASRHRAISAPLIVGFLLRGGFVFADQLVLGFSSTVDGAGWHRHAEHWASKGLGEVLSHVEAGHQLYKVFMGLLYYLFGSSTAMVQMVNAFVGTLVILVVWRLAGFLSSDPRSARRAAWLIALFPSAILHSGLLLREAFVTLPLTLGVYHLALWHRHRLLKNAVMAGASLLASMAFHSGAFAVLVALLAWTVGSWVKALFSGKARLFGRNTAALLLAGGVVFVVSGTGWGMSKFSRVDTEQLDSITGPSRGRSAYLEGMEAETPAELVVQAPVRVVYFLFAPFPWMVSGIRDLVGVIDSLFFFWLVSRGVRGRRFFRRMPTATLVAALFLSLAVTFALGVSNYGTAFRHRSKMLPVLIALGAVIPLRRRQPRYGPTIPLHALPARPPAAPPRPPVPRPAGEQT